MKNKPMDRQISVYKRPRSEKMKNDSEMREILNKCFEDAYHILDRLDIKYGQVEEIKINKKAGSRWGLCKSKINGKYSIEISSRLLQDDVSYEAVMNTIIHELLHCHMNRHGHKGEWKRCAELINNKYKQFNIKRTESLEEKGLKSSACIKKIKYKVTCKDCGNIMPYERKSKFIKALLAGSNDTWMCGRCNSFNLKLRIFDDNM